MRANEFFLLIRSIFHFLRIGQAFVDKFSCDLAAECRTDGIVVQCVVPGYVATKLPGLSGKDSYDVPTAETYVEAALRTVGVENRTAAYWAHKILVSSTAFIMLSRRPSFDL